MPKKPNKDQIAQIAAEMARRKLQFHRNEVWDQITLWGLFSWGTVSWLIQTGQLRTHMSRRNKTVWVTPSPEFYEQRIKPLLRRPLSEVATLAGW